MRKIGFRYLKHGLTLLMLIGAGCATIRRQQAIMLRHKLQASDLPEKWLQEPAVILDDSVVLNVQTDDLKGNSLSYRQVRTFLVNRRHPAQLEKVVIPEFSSIEMAPAISAVALYPDGTVWKLRQSDIQRRPCFIEDRYATDDRVHSFSVPRYQKGLVLRLTVERCYHRPSYYSREFFRDEYPIFKKTISYARDADSDFLSVLLNGESIAVDSLFRDSVGVKTTIFTASAIPKIESANRIKNPERWYANFNFSIPPKGLRSLDWKDLGDWYCQDIHDRLDTSEAMIAFADSIGGASPDSIVAKIFDGVKGRIRYHADFSGSHAYAPRAASKTFAQGLGDCKEMAAALTVLARLKGIDAYLALTVLEGADQPIAAVPSFDCFDHMVMAYRAADGQPRYCDPTITYAASNDSYLHLAGQKVFMLQPGASRLDTIDALPEHSDSIFTMSKIHEQEKTGRLYIEGIVALFGGAAFRHYPFLVVAHKQKQSARVKDFLENAFRLQPFHAHIVNAQSSRIVIEYRADFEQHRVKLRNGGAMLSVPSLFTGDARFISPDYEGPRYFRALKQRDQWRLHSDYASLESADLKAGFAEGQWFFENNHVVRMYKQENTVVPGGSHALLSEYSRKQNSFMTAILWRSRHGGEK